MLYALQDISEALGCGVIIMNPTELIYKGAGSPLVTTVPADGICAICGKKISDGVPIKKVVSDSFMDWNTIADTTASYVCAACTFCIKEPKTRRSQYLATESDLIWFKREDIEKHLFNPPDVPFVLFITASYKKHGSFKARVNNSSKLYYVQYEDRQILFSPNKYRDLFGLMKRMYMVFNKTQEIGKGDYIQKRVFEYGLQKWQNDETILKQYRGSQVFELLLYALNKPEEAKKKQGGK